MTKRKATYIDSQERAAEFAVGMVVVPVGTTPTDAGRVVAVWPAIGYIDVQFPWGDERMCVTDVQILNENGAPIPPHHEDIPGGAGTVEVSGGPAMESVTSAVAEAFLEKKALYWADRGRKYRSTRCERETSQFSCPRCSEKPTLKPCVYKKQVRLLGCPSCLFLIKEADILGVDLGLNPAKEDPAPTLPQGSGMLLKILRGEE